MTWASAGRIKKFKVLEYGCDTSQTRLARATGAHRTFNARFTHAWGTLLKQHQMKSERTWNVHWRASNAHQTRTERIQRACSARGTYSGRISHTPEARRAFRKLLSMFKNFFKPNRARNVQRLLATYSEARRKYTKRTQRACSEF